MYEEDDIYVNYLSVTQIRFYTLSAIHQGTLHVSLRSNKPPYPNIFTKQ